MSPQAAAGRPDHEGFVELVVGHALDALEPAEEQVLLGHLPQCARCRGLLDEATHIASALAYDTPDVAPPVSLLESIRAGVEASGLARDVEPAASPAVSPPPVVPEGIPRRRASDRQDDELSRRRRARHRIASAANIRVAAAVAAIALIATGGYAVHARSDRNAAHTALTSDRTVLAHLADAGAYSVTLQSGGAATGAAVVDGHTVYLVTDGLGANDATKTIYVLWAPKADGSMVALRGFDVTGNDETVVSASLPDSVSSPRAFAITHEAGRVLPLLPSAPVLGVRT